MENPPKILVHLHIYYRDQVDYFIEKLKNLVDCEYSLYVTMVGSDSVAEGKLRAFDPGVNIKDVPNCGYDVAPFLDFVQNVDLSQYDYVLKLHTKRSRNGDVYLDDVYVGGTNWGDSLVDSLLGSAEIFRSNLRTMNSRPETGMIAAYDFIVPCYKWQAKKDLDKVYQESKHLFENQENIRFWYVAGTMFFCRANLLKVLQSERIALGCFEKPRGEGEEGFSLAHLYERILGLIVYAQGYVITGVNYKKSDFYVSPEMAIEGLPPYGETKVRRKLAKAKKTRDIYLLLCFLLVLSWAIFLLKSLYS